VSFRVHDTHVGEENSFEVVRDAEETDDSKIGRKSSRELDVSDKDVGEG
jgi:hypothetical protein